MSRLNLLLLLAIVGVGCHTPGDVSSPPPPPPPPPNHPPVAAVVGGPYTSDSGLVSFDGSASSDSDGDALTYAWDFGDGATGTGVSTTHNYQQDGTFNVSLVVKDSKGASSTPATTTAAVSHPAVLVGAGNVATCGMSTDEKTASIVDTISGTVFTLGDNAFEFGSDSEYQACYAPAWGRFLSRTRPTLGNHDYANGGGDASGSFDYFGDRLGTRGLGYYSYDVGSWHVIVLNDKGDTDPQHHGIDPVQMQWLTADLDAHPKACTIAMFHVALFISSNTPGWTTNPEHKPIWDLLYAKGVDVVLNGQQHNYERFAPMAPDGTVDTARGIREFNVGTGGESVVNFTVAIHPHSEVRSATFGVLKLKLTANRYDWAFVPIAGATFTDSGSGTCH